MEGQNSLYGNEHVPSWGWIALNPTGKQRRRESKPSNSIPFHSFYVGGTGSHDDVDVHEEMDVSDGLWHRNKFNQPI